jgi:hypothetical protein
VKADAIEEGTEINFPSFDIASAMYHADQQAFTIGYMYELRILTEVQRHLDYMYHNPEWAKSLRVPGTKLQRVSHAAFVGRFWPESRDSKTANRALTSFRRGHGAQARRPAS